MTKFIHSFQNDALLATPFCCIGQCFHFCADFDVEKLDPLTKGLAVYYRKRSWRQYDQTFKQLM